MWSAFRSLRPLSRVPPEGKVTSAILCQYRCQQVRDCRGFHWREDTKMCTLTAAYGREVVEPTNSPLDVIGPKYCSKQKTGRGDMERDGHPSCCLCVWPT